MPSLRELPNQVELNSLREYQEEAADFIYSRDRSLILAKMGAGKTAIALTAMQDYLRNGLVKRWLVIAPKRVCACVWPVEVAKWSNMTLRVAVGTPAQRIAALYSDADVVVINYDNLQWLATQKLSFDGIVFDELTRLKNPSGKRFKAFNEVVANINIRIGLTGSFTSNGLEDVFGQVKMIDQSALGRSKGAFMQQYFWCANPQFGEWIPRPKALDQIMARIKSITFMLENKEYADTLPPLHYNEVMCEMDMTNYKKMKKDFVLELGSDKAIAANAGVVTQKLQQLAGGWIYETKTVASDEPGKFITTQTPHWFSAHKFDALDELVGNGPLLIWYWYKEELAELRRRYPKAQTLDDKGAVERWNAGQIDVLLAHPASAGHGLNLQGQSDMVFLSLPWSLELFEQAVARLHRSGQRHAVYCHLLLTAGTVDEKIWGALRDKKSLSEIAIESLKNS
jgi:SNF2 family DNA or RNA helicase